MRDSKLTNVIHQCLNYTLIIVAIPIVIQEVKEKYTPVIIILYLSIYEHKLLPQINKPTNGKIPTKEQSVATSL